eukprot:GHVT01102641.1.p3 GENE.GHVT01102641.1~~GHVT01102641.1.p3  ORF type:complete len:118 (-),score=20.80 GHVT01102641.1:413-766(-)
MAFMMLMKIVNVGIDDKDDKKTKTEADYSVAYWFDDDNSIVNARLFVLAFQVTSNRETLFGTTPTTFTTAHWWLRVERADKYDAGSELLFHSVPTEKQPRNSSLPGRRRRRLWKVPG